MPPVKSSATRKAIALLQNPVGYYKHAGKLGLFFENIGAIEVLADSVEDELSAKVQGKIQTAKFIVSHYGLQGSEEDTVNALHTCANSHVTAALHVIDQDAKAQLNSAFQCFMEALPYDVTKTK
eukprot:CAMPEP_0185251782 /NCGR_PEP_ID=MMETSP1359-20130426/1106_1 /TAXON_ID=552665 /ORGANISM="Bigelowiella longifila, Strain CCMP242" /LENGTH=123 /DNA_ID=CAMNT_0027833799 /DNA_START=111 /DNA_END=482 /DNA_ORIENTATION=-